MDVYFLEKEMDQSTQCDFPVVIARKSRNGTVYLKKRHTEMNLNSSLQTLTNPWLRTTPLSRPRSLNVSTETFHRSRISFLSETTQSPRPSSHSSDLTIPLSREKTPPPPPPPLPRFYNNNHHKEHQCRCFVEDYKGSPPSATPEGLSWRRLHMSRAKLKATSTTSELLSGFAMVAMVELQINEETNVPEWLFIMFAICTTVLVSVHIFALMISTYILPNIDAISKLDVCELVAESPHERMKGFIELAWAFSTVLGLFLFLVEVAILCWVKFWDYSFKAATAATIIVIPVLIIFVLFTVHFYHSLVVYKCDTSSNDMERLEELKKNLDQTHPV
ncbi:PREDICTED: calcium release-activated calcium channel protein 1-like isoform X2 [Nicrophorus vespilloides]|uniref:Calcium release-activated calcium channel protein 1-like isoform X2 n=1 Tax=Nicrophorus vespilloides TaxID=110193 RepID=A0ABM1NE85_NICVS|nr:PREDICTED: calcium release-activated calcium channel protein 1-like isoform X2 [Nicrophorus vespilloides]